MLEQAVVFEGNAADTTEDSALHEMFGIAPEAINDIMVIEDIQLWYLGVCCSKSSGRIPFDVVVIIVSVALVA